MVRANFVCCSGHLAHHRAIIIVQTKTNRSIQDFDGKEETHALAEKHAFQIIIRFELI